MLKKQTIFMHMHTKTNEIPLSDSKSDAKPASPSSEIMSQTALTAMPADIAHKPVNAALDSAETGTFLDSPYALPASESDTFQNASAMALEITELKGKLEHTMVINERLGRENVSVRMIGEVRNSTIDNLKGSIDTLRAAVADKTRCLAEARRENRTLKDREGVWHTCIEQLKEQLARTRPRD